MTTHQQAGKTLQTSTSQLQKWVQYYTEKYKNLKQWTEPSPRDALVWTSIEAGEALDEAMRFEAKWNRNNPREASTNKLGQEMADVMFMLLYAANLYEVDLGKFLAFKLDKMRMDRTARSQVGLEK